MKKRDKQILMLPMIAILVVIGFSLQGREEGKSLTDVSIDESVANPTQNHLIPRELNRQEILDSIRDDEQYLVFKKADGVIIYMSVYGDVVAEAKLKTEKFSLDKLIKRPELTSSEEYRDPRIEAFHGTPTSWKQFSTPYPDGERIAYKRSGSFWKFDSNSGAILKLFDYDSFPEFAPYPNLGQTFNIIGILQEERLLVSRNYRDPNTPYEVTTTEYWVFDPETSEFRKTPISGKLTFKHHLSLNGVYLIYGVNTVSPYNPEEGKHTDQYRIFNLESWWYTGTGQSQLLTSYPGEIRGWVTTEEIEEKIPSVKKKDLGFSFMKMLTCPDTTCYYEEAGFFYLPFPCGIAAHVNRNGINCNVSECNLTDALSPLISGYDNTIFNPHDYRGIDFSDLRLAGLMHGEGLEYLCTKNGKVYLSGEAPNNNSAGWRVSIRHNIGDPEDDTDDVFSQYYHMQPHSIPLEVAVDSIVSIGQVLGVIGNSGVSDIHVHFDTRHAGTDGEAQLAIPGSFWPRFHETGEGVIPTKKRIYVSQNGSMEPCNRFDCSSVTTVTNNTSYSFSTSGEAQNVHTYYSEPTEFGGSSMPDQAPPDWDCSGPEKVFKYSAPPGPFKVVVSAETDLDVFILHNDENDCNKLDPLQDCVGVTCSDGTSHNDCFPDIGPSEHVVYVPLKDNLNGGIFHIVIDGENEEGETAEMFIEQAPITEIQLDEWNNETCIAILEDQSTQNGGDVYRHFCGDSNIDFGGMNLVYSFYKSSEGAVAAILENADPGIFVHMMHEEDVLVNNLPIICSGTQNSHDAWVYHDAPPGMYYVFVSALTGVIDSDFNIVISGPCGCTDNYEMPGGNPISYDSYNSIPPGIMSNGPLANLVGETGGVESMHGCVGDDPGDWYPLIFSDGLLSETEIKATLLSQEEDLDLIWRYRHLENPEYESQNGSTEIEFVEGCFPQTTCFGDVFIGVIPAEGCCTDLEVGYTLLLEVTTEAECTPFAPEEDNPNLLSLTLEANAAPNEVCFGHPSTLSVNGGIGPYTWFLSGVLIGEGASIEVSPGITTTYTVHDLGASCSTASVTVTVDQSLTLIGENVSTTPGSEAQLYIEAVGGQEPYFYVWSADPDLSCTGCQNPIVTTDETSIYTAIVIDADLCIDTNYITVQVVENDNCIPENDEPCGATPFIASPDIEWHYVHNICATTTNAPPAILCVDDQMKNDVWIKLIMLSDDAIVHFDTDYPAGDFEAALYKAVNPLECDAFIFEGCFPNGSPHDANNWMPHIEITDANILDVYYVRIWNYGVNQEETFKVAFVDEDINLDPNDDKDLTEFSDDSFVIYNSGNNTVTFAIEFWNAGTDEITEDFMLSLFASTNTTITTSDINLANLAITSDLDSEDTYLEFFSIQLDQYDIPSDDYYFGWKLDIGDDVEESNENNNTFVASSHSFLLPNTEQNLPDYRIKDEELDVSLATPGMEIFAECRVKNYGDEDAPESSRLHYLLLEAEDECGITAIFLEDDLISAIGEGNQRYRSETVTIPIDIIPGMYKVCFWADAEHYEDENNGNDDEVVGRILEEDEFNNCECVELEVVSQLPYVDYLGTNFSIEGSAMVTPFENRTLNFTINNAGTTDAGNNEDSHCKGYISQSPDSYNTEDEIFDVFVNNLDAGASESFEVNVEMPCWVFLVEHVYIHMVVDTEDDVEEGNSLGEENNTAILTLLGGSESEPLVALIINSPESVCPNEQFTVEAFDCAQCEYTWNFGFGDLVNGRIATYNYDTPGFHSILLTVTNPCGGVESDVNILQVSEPPVISMVTPDTCVSESGSVMASIEGNSNEHTFEWNTGAITQTINNLSSGLYIVTVTNQDGCTTAGIEALSCYTDDPQVPVELITFDVHNGEGRTANVFWATVSENNTDVFQVQHSINAEDWSTIGSVQASGFTTDIRQYDFIDYSPKSGENYYRLKIIDYDGSFEYSEVRIVLLEQSNDLYHVIPINEHTYRFVFETVQTQRERIRTVEVFTTNGVQLQNFTTTEREVEIKLPQISQIYFVRVLIGKEFHVKKLVVLRH